MANLTILTEKTINECKEFAYDKVLNGVAGSYQELAESYLKEKGSISDKADSLIRCQIAKCATSGFFTGLVGVLALPVSIPANLVSVLYVQLRMVAAIAYMGGYDPRDDQVKTFVYACLLGNSAEEAFKGKYAVPIGKALAESAIKKIPREIIGQINKVVGVKLITKFSEKGIINLGKAVPVVGGVVGGTLDAVTTKAIGEMAKKYFLSKNP